MIPVSLTWISEQLDGQLSGADITIQGVSTDTRTIKPGDLFIALVGPNFNGHEFIPTALEKGAAALIISEPQQVNVPTIVVHDTHKALGQLGAAIKAKVAPKTVGITGSSGKTTVKEMVAAILARRGNVLATDGNFNNDIGVPLTLLRLEQQHEYAVIEMGANHLGEIAYTTQLVKPDAATIVNAAEAHLQGFGSLLGVARAKSEIFQGLNSAGVAVLNADSQFHDFWATKLTDIQVQRFSLQQNADFCARRATLGADGCASFELVTPQGNAWVNLVLPGMHNVGNALVAAALAMAVGATLDDVQLGLENMRQVKGRTNVYQLTSQVRLLDDTYNANVLSVNAAIDLLASYPGQRILVLGDMAELGEKARFYHEQVGEYARNKGLELLFTLGVLSQHASTVFNGNGRHFSDIDTLISELESRLLDSELPITILVKGSRSARMERVVDAIRESRVGKLEFNPEAIAC
ncbi:UDP-N-acetylmuramoyl-tripeptide--D-alanyl-D-alanine ligase [Bowmanella sp. JS7-9]|uniref:UDP-N-acetylmuramoyl-tripeptide--D-alanyl-D-alanine ligase n=1 Tax=Pseudobowmanella zhangzhouensis TaxID=1537679 RepID=A0ABW1XFG1_9ALTE|nr:UDP-N-acetylmuramoyl-tripeptide--D-alanyl-D-alanine ligase [Bowmanella sp. JS7-9]TBX21294.1 UDP-N-acetylmuramoyl-tripeptide--D-alanyl-D-alanine ligase [Bowmanella sp. JS7-9]